MTLPPPVTKEHDGILVVRDDLIAGGSKRRFVDRLIVGKSEVVYASPCYGGAQIAIAHAAREIGARATIFVAKRKNPHPRTIEAKNAGARIMQVPYGYLSNVQAKARAYCEMTGAYLLPFGLESPEMIAAIAGGAAGLNLPKLDQVWCVAGSGVLARSLRIGLPDARSFHIVRVGKALSAEAINGAIVHEYPLPFDRDAKIKPPFPSCSNYDAKAWEFIVKYRKGTVLFWNVMG